MTILTVTANGWLTGMGAPRRCALGKGGVVEAADKREGDGASPAGTWPIRRVYFRADRVAKPETGLEIISLRPNDGWCDAPGDARYNRPVLTPYTASHETLWREDHVYDLIVELGYNDDPVVTGKGSAIFMHIAREAYQPTEGCVALHAVDLREILAALHPGDAITIKA